MRRLLILLSAVCLFNTIAFARSPVGDWQSVQDIPSGWQITVVTGFTFPCIFVRASDDELICENLQPGWAASDPREVHVHRDRIREIRVERRDGANMLAGSALGGSAGAGFGAIAAASSKGAPAYLFGAVGAMLGAHMGHNIHILRGKVVYRSDVPPSTQKKASDAVQAAAVQRRKSVTSPSELHRDSGAAGDVRPGCRRLVLGPSAADDVEVESARLCEFDCRTHRLA